MNKKIIFVIVGVVAVVLIVLIFFSKGSLIVTSNPSENVALSVNGSLITAGQTNKLKAGTYDVKAELADYIPYVKEIKLGMFSSKELKINLRVLPIPQKAVEYKTQFSTLSEDGKSIYYLSNNGKTMYAIDNMKATDLLIMAVSPDFFSNVTDIIWSPNRDLAIIKQNTKTLLYDFKRYDLLHQEFYPFSSGIGNITWRSDGEKLLYYYAPEGGETTLIEANKDNTGMVRIYNFKDTTIRNPEIDWSPDQQNALLLFENKLYILDFFSKNLTPLLENTTITQVQFTPDNNILYVTSDGLHICDKTGNNDKLLNIKTTLEKVTFIDTETMIFVEKIDGIETFFLYNFAKDMKTELIYNTKVQINPIDIIPSQNLKKIYFESNGYLYQMDLETKNY